MSERYRAHYNLLNEVGFAYFQRCDSEIEFPTSYFDRLAGSGLLFHDVDDAQTALEFTNIGRLVGSFSVAAGITWVMHNQQWNCIRAIATPDILARLQEERPLIASVTSRYRGPAQDFLVPEGPNFRLVRRAPVCSYRHHAAQFLVAVPYQEGPKLEDWLVLIPSEKVETIGEANVLSAARSTLSGPISIDCSVRSNLILGPLSAVHAGIFVPLAHLGWMSAFIGGLSGVLDRLRVLLREGRLGDRHTDKLFRSRVAIAVSRLHGSASLVRDCASLCFSDRPLRGVMLNVLKTEVSAAVSAGAAALTEALGMGFSLTEGDAIGLEMYARDVRAATLMVHNDLFYDHIFDQWHTKFAQLDGDDLVN